MKQPIKGIIVLQLNGAMYSKAAADDLVNTLLINGYTITMKQINTLLCIEYSYEISDAVSMEFPLNKN